jgi:hypothetical protein
MHGTSPATIAPGQDVFAPHRQLFSDDGSKRNVTPARSPCLRSKPRYGLSLTCSDCPLPDHHCKVIAPDLHLRLPADPFPKAVPLSAPSLYPCLDSSFGRSQRHSPYFRLHTSASDFPGPPLPEKELSFPFGSKRSVRINHRRTYLQNRPDSCHSPNSLLLTSCQSGSTLQVRYRF